MISLLKFLFKTWAGTRIASTTYFNERDRHRKDTRRAATFHTILIIAILLAASAWFAPPRIPQDIRVAPIVFIHR
jgi:hypothetical protein